MIPVNSYVVKRSIEHYGKDLQSTVCMEECAELIQAISKEKRGESDKDHLSEEIADVLICIEMLRQIYNITEDEIYSWVINKQERIIRRIEKDTQATKTNAERIRNMTESESIKICNTIGFATSFSNPQGIPLNTTKEELTEAMRMSIQALKKQIPNKPHKNFEKFSGVWCSCGKYLGKGYFVDKPSYCSDCGQKLDWSDNNDK